MTNPQETASTEFEQEQPPELLEDDSTYTDLSYAKNRITFGLALAFSGYLVFLLGARPSLFGLDRSPVVGFVQISVFLFGLALINLGGYMTLNAHWPEGKKTIAAEIGARLISTGYVICVFTGMADIFGLGSHPLPNVFFGPLQARGMALGIMTIAVGFLLMIRFNNNGLRKLIANKPERTANQDPKPSQTGDSDSINIKLSALFQ
jgi:hypothetical protein